MAKVSAIIPVFNGEHTVTRTVDDLLDGTLQDLEVILVDDGSTDGSAKVCEELTRKDSRIHLYQKENGGPASARNYGLDRASGEFIAFIDDDDRVDPAYLQKLLDCLEKRDLDWVVCGHRRVYRQEGDAPDPVRSVDPVFPEETILRGQDGRTEVIRAIFHGTMGRNLFHNGMGMYRRSMLENHKLRIPETVRYGEDVLFNYMVARHIRGFAYLPEPLYTYTIHGGSASSELAKTDLYRQEMALVEELDRLRMTFGDEWTDPMLRYVAVQILHMFRAQLLDMEPKDRRRAAYREVEERFSRPPFSGILSRLRRDHVDTFSMWAFLCFVRRGWYGGMDLIWRILRPVKGRPER